MSISVQRTPCSVIAPVCILRFLAARTVFAKLRCVGPPPSWRVAISSTMLSKLLPRVACGCPCSHAPHRSIATKPDSIACPDTMSFRVFRRSRACFSAPLIPVIVSSSAPPFSSWSSLTHAYVQTPEVASLEIAHGPTPRSRQRGQCTTPVRICNRALSSHNRSHFSIWLHGDDSGRFRPSSRKLSAPTISTHKGTDHDDTTATHDPS